MLKFKMLIAVFMSLGVSYYVYIESQLISIALVCAIVLISTHVIQAMVMEIHTMFQKWISVQIKNESVKKEVKTDDDLEPPPTVRDVEKF